MTRLVFMDTETTGLEHDADVWEFAAIIRTPGHDDHEVQFCVEHDIAKAARLPEPFLSDYRSRYVPEQAVPVAKAVTWMASIFTGGTHVVGAVPNFDTERIARLFRAHGVEPGWHYHLIDVETLAVGFLAGVCRLGGATVDKSVSWLTGPPPLPWDSDTLSRGLGVEPPKQGEGRHTALGDARWTRDLYDAVMRKS